MSKPNRNKSVIATATNSEAPTATATTEAPTTGTQAPEANATTEAPTAGTGTELATTGTQAPEVGKGELQVQAPVATMVSDLIIGENCEVMLPKDWQHGAEGLALASESLANSASSALRQSANIIRLGRMLDPITVGDATVSAFDYVYARMRELVKEKGGLFKSVSSLIWPLDVCDANDLSQKRIWQVQNAKAYLEELELVDKKGKFTEKALQRVKDSDGNDTAEYADMVIAGLKNGSTLVMKDCRIQANRNAKANGLALPFPLEKIPPTAEELEAIAKAKADAKEKELADEKAKADAEAKAKADAPTAGTETTEETTGDSLGNETVTPAPTTPTAPKLGTVSAEVANERVSDVEKPSFVSVFTRLDDGFRHWDKMIVQAENPAETLATLMRGMSNRGWTWTPDTMSDEFKKK
jgi:hypothetical protein